MTKQKVWRVVRIVTGGVLVVLGVIGLFLPILQGTLLLVMGLGLLSRESSRIRSLLGWVRGRLPRRISRHLEGLRHGGIGDAR
jgi:uncharacterized membrane protein YbaN (DUF454 family)